MEKSFNEYKQFVKVNKCVDKTTGVEYLFTVIKKEISKSERIVPVLELTCDGDYSKVTSLYDYMIDKDILFGVNAGIFNTGTNEPDCVVVKNKKVLFDRLETYVHKNDNDGEEKRNVMYILGIKENGDLKMYEPSWSGEQIVEDGCVDAVMAFVPLIIDYKEFEKSDEIVCFGSYLDKQRQVIGQLDNGDYYVLTVLEPGLTFKQTRRLLLELGVPFAYALDNGSSTQTMLHKERLTPVYRHETGRRIPTILLFEVKKTGV